MCPVILTCWSMVLLGIAGIVFAIVGIVRRELWIPVGIRLAARLFHLKIYIDLETIVRCPVCSTFGWYQCGVYNNNRAYIYSSIGVTLHKNGTHWHIVQLCLLRQ